MNDTTEGKLQQQCFIWFHNTFPELRGLLCYNLNNSKNKIDGALNKSKGLIPGRSDMVFYYCGNAYMIELKTTAGVQSHEQKKWQETIESEEFKYFIIRTLNDFRDLINKIINKTFVS